MKNEYDVLVVGAGHAGAQTCAALRQFGFGGSIGLVGDEREPPYERPPLSKEYLAGEKSLERILIRPVKFWEDRMIDLMAGRRAVAVDPQRRRVTLSDGVALGYGRLVWAAGGSPRRLSCAGSDLQGVHYLRTRADADGMRAQLSLARSVVIVGGGYIGLETAAVLNKLGKSVTVLEAQPRVLARVAGEPLSRFYEQEHRAHGVRLRLGAQVDRIEGAAGRATGVRLADGTLLPADMVVVGIGIVPAVGPLVAAGVDGPHGVPVNQFCETTLAGVFAIGDCAVHESAFGGGMPIRIESVQNANDMATTVAKFICGDGQPYQAIPWFWSNQYDLRLQTVGLSAGHDQAVVRGDPASRRFSVVYLRQGRVLAADCVNMTKDYVHARHLVAARVAVPVSRLADAGVPLQSLLQ